jgi:dTDP-4-amino-4,6-dideoxygalactose transaminase
MISFYPASMGASVRDALEDCARRGVFPGGHYTARVEALLRDFGAECALLTPSCTASLQIACRLAGIGPGDEVILPSYNFPAAANAVLLAGGTPVLCDIDPGTQNLSVADTEKRLTRRTRAVIAVHYAAVACEMDALGALCDASGLALIEDAAQAVGATYRGRHLGTMGRFGCYSFHATKVFSSGEGGALLSGLEDSKRAVMYRTTAPTGGLRPGRR